jgi:hypothetical protein
LSRKVDVITEKSMRPRARERALKEAGHYERRSGTLPSHPRSD